MKCQNCHTVLVFACLLLFCSQFGDSIENQTSTTRCSANERNALLRFKQGAEADQPCLLLTSWVGRECCQWYGIRCSSRSGHVVSLNLSGVQYYNSPYPYLIQGTVTPSLGELKYLMYLDLSFNNFEQQPIPSFIGTLLNLKHLDLSLSGFVGEVPRELGNLSRLTYLDLSQNYDIYVKSLKWLSNLKLLTDIDLSFTNLNLATDWMESVSNLPFLRNLQMVDCSLYQSQQISSPLVVEYTNSSTSLHNISLSQNLVNDTRILQWVSDFTKLSLGFSYLDLSQNGFSGPIPSAFGSMHSLSYLDLSLNNFQGPFPETFSQLEHLQNLNLSFNNFQGPIPETFSQLELLQNLDLSNNQFEGPIPKTFSQLEHLQHLDLSYNKLQGPIPETFSQLEHLQHLDLSYNKFEGPIPKTFSQLKHLQHLDLSDNKFQGPIPETFSQLEHLQHLDLSLNNFQGSEWNPQVLGSLCGLQVLSLRENNITSELSTIIQPLSQCVHSSSLGYLNIQGNRLWGSLPDGIGTLSSLVELDLRNNQLNGSISPNIGKLLMLEGLLVSSNSLKGTISNHHLSNLSRLTVLDLSDNPELVFNFSSNWVPPFQLDVVHLRSCKLGPSFPKWLLTQTNFSSLDISNAYISDTIPTVFWDLLTPNLVYMNMSRNMINGNIPDMPISLYKSPTIDLSSNWFHGGIPSFLISVSLLNLNDNNFSDLAPFFCPNSQVSLSTLTLSNNKFSGELPTCWGYFESLSFVSFDNNNFSGKLPESIGIMTQLRALHLRNNSISGNLPVTLQNCTYLLILDLSYNSLTGHIPYWIGDQLASLVILNLRNNNFLGRVPLSLCRLSELQILDFSTNHFSGFIPNCIWNLTAMTKQLLNVGQTIPSISITIDEDDFLQTYIDSAWIMWKGGETSFGSTLTLVIAIDMSNNELEGPIPDGISSLRGLKSLDLSRNRLTGSITQKIGQLTSLEFLDLSRNQLSGEIPGSISIVSSLAMLNVSYNNLSGRIPHGTQLQSFNPSSYVGNPGLCGDPLSRCPGDPTPANSPKEDKSSNHEDDDDNDDDSLFPGLYISVVLGFIVGFWGICGSLVIKRSWRRTFFGFFDDIKDELYVFVAVNLARIRRRNT